MFSLFYRPPVLNAAHYTQLIAGSHCLEQDSHGPKVLCLRDERILKIFYPRKGLSLSRLFPQALRFARNAQALQDLGIPTLEVERLLRLPHGNELAVLYRPLPGMTLRQLLAAHPAQEELLRQTLARFINHLHRTGVYFRSLHLGNIISMPSGELGLIDIADLKILRSGLRPGLIERNRAHFEHYIRKEGLAFDCQALWRACAADER